MRKWFVKVHTSDGCRFCCDCTDENVAAIVNAAYDEFGVCAVTVMPQ